MIQATTRDNMKNDENLVTKSGSEFVMMRQEVLISGGFFSRALRMGGHAPGGLISHGGHFHQSFDSARFVAYIPRLRRSAGFSFVPTCLQFDCGRRSVMLAILLATKI